MEEVHSPGKSLPWTSPAALRERGFSVMTTFSLQRPAALAKVIINLVEWSVHHLDPFNVLEAPSKLTFTVNIFPSIPGVFTIAWNKSGLEGGKYMGSWKGLKIFRNRLRN